MELKSKTKTFSFLIKNLVKKIRLNFIKAEIARQLLRSGMSVGANTRAAYRGRSKREFIAKLGIVIEETDECIFWLDMLEDEEISLLEEIDSLRNEATEILSIFVSIRKKNT